MVTIARNNVNDLKDILVKYYFKDITKVEHIGDFNFIAYTPDSRIKIKSKPVDDYCNFINILSIEITFIN